MISTREYVLLIVYRMFSPFGQFVIIVTINCSLSALETNVVKSSKRCSVYVRDFVIGYQKQFLHNKNIQN